jgi:RNA polymerase sigma factor (sigma-70 family)
MVLRVCRQVIGDRQDAEDAAQAVFLVLARKASSIRVDDTLASWLHGVARRVAAKARGRAAARRQIEQRTAIAAAMVRHLDRNDDGGPSVDEWEAVHDEVGRLPEKYRTPVVLCYLQGQTYEQAARRIGCPVGTVRVRLSRARERLRGRLTRRGFGPERVTAVGWFMSDPGAILLLATASSTAGMLLGGAAWVEATVKAARAFSVGREAMAGTVSASVLYFYEEVVRAMMMNWWRTAAVWLLAAGMTVAGAIGFAAGGPSGQDKGATSKNQPGAATAPKNRAPEPPEDLDSSETLRKQTERRAEAARQRLDAQIAYYEEERIPVGRWIDASRQLMLAETAASTTKEQRVTAAKAHFDRMIEAAAREERRLKDRRGNVADTAEAVLARENAAVGYLEARQSRGSEEVEALKKRVETLEKELERVLKRLEHSGTDKR